MCFYMVGVGWYVGVLHTPKTGIPESATLTPFFEHPKARNLTSDLTAEGITISISILPVPREGTCGESMMRIESHEIRA